MEARSMSQTLVRGMEEQVEPVGQDESVETDFK
jgi:hypothetical protein